MDDIVKQALAKWPNVPDCYGWLGLDARGNWYMRDDRTQALGAFADGSVASKGSMLKHEKLIAFIARNYLPDLLGRWAFQNGPQRVFVELESTPLVWRIGADYSLVAHTGTAGRARRCLVDELGRVYLEADAGFGLVHTQDVALAAEAIDAGLWQPEDARSELLPQRYGYVRSPQALQQK